MAQDRTQTALRLALWQGPSPAGRPEVARQAIAEALRAAGALGANCLVLPEVFLPGYNHPDIARLALPQHGDWSTDLASLCRNAGCALVLGYAERAGDRIFNAALVLDDQGRRLGNYRKIQLYGPRERAIYTPGGAYLTFDLGGRMAAVLICYDVEFAPHIAALARRGVEVILVPTANMQPFVHVGLHTVPAMAASHGVSILYANFCGSEGELRYTGGSVIAGPHGEVLAQAGEEAAFLVADLPARDPARLSTQALDFRALD